MNKALLLSIIFILCASFALAEIVVTSETTTEEINKAFIVESTNSGIKIEATIDVGVTYIYVNEKLVDEFESLEAGDKESIRFSKGTEDEIEIRFLKEYEYTWDSYEITQDDKPLFLKYLKYDKDNKYVKFSLEGADIVHPDIIKSTKRSVGESLNEYEVIVDEETGLTCYPKITTGQNIYFKCKCSVYPHVIDISATLGVSEKTIIAKEEPEEIVPEIPIEKENNPVKKEAEEEIENTQDEEEILISEEDQGNTSAPEETQILNNISMQDTILESQGMGNAVKFFIIGLFLAVCVLFFVASHHKHENKKAGVHHPHKKKKK